MSENKFVIVGPPAMGKSTILRLIPSVIRLASGIDLERLMRNASDAERGSVHAHVRHISAMPWNGPLFLGNAAAYFPFIASFGFRVIALHHPDHQEYLNWMQKRDQREDQPSQGDHWQWHRDEFDKFRSSYPERILMIDTILEYPSNIIGVILRIAEHFGLELYRNLPGEPHD